MAVYTNINEDQVIDFFKLYDIGELISFSGITEGIENSNFHLKTSNGNYILTIFEKRVDIKDIPFFIKIMLHLNKNCYYCPKPIYDKNGKFLQELRGKPTIIVNFLEGKSKKNITIEDCNQKINSILEEIKKSEINCFLSGENDNFNIYNLNTYTGNYSLLKEGVEDQPNIEYEYPSQEIKDLVKFES